MKVRGFVLKERPYVGDAGPPDTFEDASRDGNDGTHTDITWVREAGGLWVRDYNGTSSYLNIATHAPMKLGIADFSLSWWTKSSNLIADYTAILGDGDNRVSAISSGYTTEIYDTTGQFRFAANAVGNLVAWAGMEPYFIDGIWHHWVLAGRRGAGTLELWRDAVSQGQQLPANFTDPIVGGSPFRMGRHNTSTSWFDGRHALVKQRRYAFSGFDVASIFRDERRWFGV